MAGRIIELNDSYAHPIPWGIQGESGATVLHLDITDFSASYPGGKAVVIFQRQDGKPYTHKFVKEEKNLFIELDATDTQLIGKCEIAISWVAPGNRLLKKANFHSFILPSALEEPLPLTEESIMALDNLKGYVEEAKELLKQAHYRKQVQFCTELPASGEENQLYVDITNDEIYFWKENKFVLLGAGSQFVDYTAIMGGDASGKYQNILFGGYASEE